MINDKLKILQIAPIFFPLSGDIKYGGIERVVYMLDREYSKLGHLSSVSALKDSKIYGKLISKVRNIEVGNGYFENIEKQEKNFSYALDYAIKKNVDIIHDHTGRLITSTAYKDRSIEIPILVTPHQKIDGMDELPDKKKIWFNVLSKAQKERFSNIPIETVIYNGLNVKEFPFKSKKQNYLFSLGSIEYDKGQDLAVKLALEKETPLIIGGPIHDKAFFEKEIEPHLGEQIKYVGSLNDEQKIEYFRDAKAFIAPIRVPDCFSLVRIESLACGTPVITLDSGSANEAIENGVTGFIVGPDTDELEGLKYALSKIDSINSNICRTSVETKFSLENQVNQYLSLYRKIINEASLNSSTSIA